MEAELQRVLCFAVVSTVILQYFACTLLLQTSQVSIQHHVITEELNIHLWEWLLVGVVKPTLKEHSINSKRLASGSCSLSDISAVLCIITGVKVVHTPSDFSVLLTGSCIVGVVATCEANESVK